MLRRRLRGALSIAEDAVFDVLYGVETQGRVAIGASRGIVGDNADGARAYHPTRGRHLRRIFAWLDLPPGLGLLDVGCGKGLVLLRATAEPFGRIVGLEHAESLVSVAQDNVARFRRRTQRGASIEVVHADAATWELPPDLHVVYLFNPFDEPVFAAVMDRVHESVSRAPRPLWVVVNKARFDGLVQSRGVLCRRGRFTYGSADVTVYRNAPADAVYSH